MEIDDQSDGYDDEERDDEDEELSDHEEGNLDARPADDPNRLMIEHLRRNGLTPVAEAGLRRILRRHGYDLNHISVMGYGRDTWFMTYLNKVNTRSIAVVCSARDGDDDARNRTCAASS